MPKAVFDNITTVFPKLIPINCHYRQFLGSPKEVLSTFVGNKLKMGSIKDTCFVCKTPLSKATSSINVVVNMPVCEKCKGSKQEKIIEKEVLDSLADGFVCGCI
jgi:hypothetical protein